VVAPLIERWARLYNDHKAVSDAVTFAHLAAIMVGGGVAIASDRAALAMAPASDVPTRRRWAGTPCIAGWWRASR